MSGKKKPNAGISLNTDMFAVTAPNSQLINTNVINIPTDKLEQFKNHPFKLYEGERFTDMVESVRANGIIIPIIVRPIDNGLYEILSGHNRVEAAKEANLLAVPAVIREGLSDDEALLIVTETNLIQRSFSDLSHSEKAAVLAVHHEATKSQGKRTDLINEIEYLLINPVKLSDGTGSETFSPLAKKLNNVVSLGQEYGLSKDSVARYLRINKLSDELKEQIDNEEISIRAGVALSYISEQAQTNLIDIINKKPELKVDIKKAEQIRNYSENNKEQFNQQMIEDILSGAVITKKARASLPVQSLKIGGKILSKYFKPEQKPEEIQAELFEALVFFREHRDSDESNIIT